MAWLYVTMNETVELDHEELEETVDYHVEVEIDVYLGSGDRPWDYILPEAKITGLYFEDDTIDQETKKRIEQTLINHGIHDRAIELAGRLYGGDK